jgi:ribosomal protein S18 acetylase RimI-like enzyme
MINIRAAEQSEVDQLAQVWFDAWNDAHAQIVPAELARLRTLENFRGRMQKELPNVRVAGSLGEPVGFCVVKGDELYQLFVAAQARGTGVAAALMADGEALLAQSGVETAWLACAIGNERAARFYEKCGWNRTGTMTNEAETSEGTFLLQVWRYEKRLPPVN